MKQGTQSRCSGIGWGRRWEWRTGWGDTCTPWPIHVDVWQKPSQYCNYPPIKINSKN